MLLYAVVLQRHIVVPSGEQMFVKDSYDFIKNVIKSVVCSIEGGYHYELICILMVDTSVANCFI